jgi:hypothetical protein
MGFSRVVHTYTHHHKHSTIGYGDISAKTTEERSLAIFVMILGAPERGGGGRGGGGGVDLYSIHCG